MGAGSMPETHCAFHLRLRGAGMLWLEKDKGSRDLAAGTAAQRMAQVGSRRKKHYRFFLAGSKDLVARTAQRTAQVGSRRKKNCRFRWQAAEISWQAQHRGWRKLAQEGKKCRFRGRHSKEAKGSKGLFLVLVFECMRIRRCMRSESGQ